MTPTWPQRGCHHQPQPRQRSVSCRYICKSRCADNVMIHHHHCYYYTPPMNQLALIALLYALVCWCVVCGVW